MYKKRFKKWKICKNTSRKMKVALCAEMKRRGGRPTIIRKNGRLWNKEHTLTRAKLEELSEADLAAATFELPPGWACATPSAESCSDTYNSQDEQKSTVSGKQHNVSAAGQTFDAGYTHRMSFGTTDFESLFSAQHSFPPSTVTLPYLDHFSLSPLYNPPLEPEPRSGVYLPFCYISCTLYASEQHQEARHVLEKASKVFASMVDHCDKDLLTCVSRVSVYLTMQERPDDAVRLLTAAHSTARLKLADFHPVVLSIEVILWQASKRRACAEIPLHMMRTLYNAFLIGWSAQHPYTIGAGYKLAWRLARTATSGDDKREALGILNNIRADADTKLGTQDLQSVGILMTKARVLKHLGNLPESEMTMADGIRRMEFQYHSLDPYQLEIQSRFADLLRATEQHHQAKQVYIRVALGRAEVLGGEHPF